MSCSPPPSWYKCKALILLVLGILFFLGTLDVIPFDFGIYWPLFLILFGLHGLFCPCWKKGSCGDKCDSDGKSHHNEKGKDGCCGSGSCMCG